MPAAPFPPHQPRRPARRRRHRTRTPATRHEHPTTFQRSDLRQEDSTRRQAAPRLPRTRSGTLDRLSRYRSLRRVADIRVRRGCRVTRVPLRGGGLSGGAVGREGGPRGSSRRPPAGPDRPARKRLTTTKQRAGGPRRGLPLTTASRPAGHSPARFQLVAGWRRSRGFIPVSARARAAPAVAAAAATAAPACCAAVPACCCAAAWRARSAPAARRAECGRTGCPPGAEPEAEPVVQPGGVADPVGVQVRFAALPEVQGVQDVSGRVRGRDGGRGRGVPAPQDRPQAAR